MRVELVGILSRIIHFPLIVGGLTSLFHTILIVMAIVSPDVTIVDSCLTHLGGSVMIVIILTIIVIIVGGTLIGEWVLS